MTKFRERRPWLWLCTVLAAGAVWAQTPKAAEAPLRGGPMVPVEGTNYSIDTYEVTNAEYALFLNERGNKEEQGVLWLDLDSKYALIEAQRDSFVAKSGFERHPAVEVSWFGANAYCQWAGKQLPSQSQWSRACRGEGQQRFPWGDSAEAGRANVFGDKDGFGRTAPVGSFPTGASPCGALDMAGNVWEWTAAMPNGDLQVSGASWLNGPVMARCDNHSSTRDAHSYIKGNSIGFRCLRLRP